MDKQFKMDYSMVITTNVTSQTPTAEEPSLRQEALLVFQVINGVLIFCTFWILVCLIAYGTKMNRWKNSSRTSSLNSGVIYTTCVAVVVLSMPRLIIDAVIFNISIIPNGLEKCELVMDLSIGANYITTYLIYFFLWLRQKVIYDHPSVREIAGKCVKVFSWIMLIGFTVLSLGIGHLYIFPLSYTSSSSGCVLKSVASQSARDIFLDSIGTYVLAGLLVILQVVLLCLFIYPMSLSHEDWIKYDFEKRESKGVISGYIPKTKKSQIKEETASFMSFCKRVIIGHPSSRTSPVARTIHRSLICCAIIVLSDILTIVVTLILPRDLPRSIPNTVYDISTLVSILCALATFGNSGRILTAVCMPCAQKVKSETRKVTDDAERKEDHVTPDSEVSKQFQDGSPYNANEPEWV